MKISNISQRVVLSDQLQILYGLEKILGLIQTSNSRYLLFKTRWGIHTWFLKEPIDVLILDNQHKIVKIFENLGPWRVAFWNPRYDIVVELPKGTISKTHTQVGDILKITS